MSTRRRLAGGAVQERNWPIKSVMGLQAGAREKNQIVMFLLASRRKPMVFEAGDYLASGQPPSASGRKASAAGTVATRW